MLRVADADYFRILYSLDARMTLSVVHSFTRSCIIGNKPLNPWLFFFHPSSFHDSHHLHNSTTSSSHPGSTILKMPVLERVKHDIYPFIDPTKALSNAAKNKSILVTGGSKGIGKVSPPHRRILSPHPSPIPLTAILTSRP